MKEEQYKRYAEQIGIFHGLKPQEVGQVLKQGATLNFRKGEAIFQEGQLGSNLFIVLKGEVGIYAKTRLIAKCKAGDTFGEMAVLNHAPRNAAASALMETRLFTLDEAGVNKILEEKMGVRFLLNIVHMLSDRLESANRWIADMRERGRRP